MPTDRGSEPDGPATANATEAGTLSGEAELAPASTLSPGDALGRYAIIERIGSGGMGVVFAAYDPALERKVALKLLRPRTGARADAARERLAREARAMARLDHPNVLAVHEAGTFGDQVFLAMDFVEGGTLRAWLQQPRSWQQIVAVFVAAGEGLAAAHDAGLVHRDFKPDNVLLSFDVEGTPRPRVTDFGLVRGTDVSSDDVPAAPRSSELVQALGP
ncbi:MAG: serine/threonine protein kinase, partial [Nannocystaceae bacterium]|nr:serine/threonine protein kinase [Nannocystaceae bacterium]